MCLDVHDDLSMELVISTGEVGCRHMHFLIFEL
jgi:hypothetical protein